MPKRDSRLGWSFLYKIIVASLIVFLVLSATGCTRVIGGEIANVTCPSSVESIKPFAILIEVQNTGNVEAKFRVELSASYLRIRPTIASIKTIIPSKSKAFEFTAEPLYTGQLANLSQSEVSAPLNLKLFADGKLVDTKSWSLQILIVVDGKIHAISCPSSVEGVKPFTVSIDVLNSGNVEADFKVELSSSYLEIISSSPTKSIAPDKLGTFEFTMKALATGQPECSTSLNIKAFANGKLVDTKSPILKILMPKLEFTSMDFEPRIEWFGRMCVFDVDLELSNLGHAAATDVTVYVELDKKEGEMDSYTTHIEYLGPASSYPITTTLNYGAFDDYQFVIEAYCNEGSMYIAQSDWFYAYPDLESLVSTITTISWVIIMFL